MHNHLAMRPPAPFFPAKSHVSSAVVDPERPFFDQSFDLLQGFLDRLNAGVVGAEAAPLGVPDRSPELDLSIGTFVDEVNKPAEEELVKFHAVF
jgi:hypothetical protein